MKVKIISLLVIAVIFVSGCTIPKIDPTPIPGAPNKDVADLKKMSLEDAQNFIKKNTVSYGGRGFAENSIAKSTISAPMAAIQQDVGY